MLSEKVRDIRVNWKISDDKRDEGLTTPEDIVRFDNISYGPYGSDNLLDIYHQKEVTKPQKTIISVHGGGWVYGSKEQYQFYGMRLAQRGFTFVNFNYRLAPEHKYPAALEDINQVFCFVRDHAKEYAIDTDHLFVVGDSAGAQLSTQYLTICSNPEYAKQFPFVPSGLKVRAVGLNCGVYDTHDPKANLDFDVFGLSYYPMWHGTMEGLQYNLNYLATTYDKEVCVVETAYAWTTEDGDGVGNVFISGDEETGGYPATVEGQFQFMNDLESVILNVPNDKGIGYFYWEPEWVPVEGGTYASSAGVAYKNDTVTPSNTWDNMTLFNFNGNALESIKVLNQPSENLLTNINFEQNEVTTSPSGWNVWLSDTTDSNTVKTEYGSAYDGNYKLTFWDDADYSCSIYKTFTNIPNGTYQFSVWAMTNGDQDVLQLYAKNYGGDELNTTIETSDINWNIFSIDEIVVTNNTLEIGVYSVAGADDWCNLDMAILRKVE